MLRTTWTLMLLSLTALGCAPEESRCVVSRDAQGDVLRVSGQCAGQDFEGVDLGRADVSGASWGSNAVCPDGTVSGEHGDTCRGHLRPAQEEDAGLDDGDADAHETHDGAHEDAPEDLQQDAPEDAPEDVPEDAPEDVSEDVPDAEDGCERNACGGCGALAHALGEPCGVCGGGRWACEGEALVCEGETSCAQPCERDGQCPGGSCTRGRCAPLGFSWVPPAMYRQGSLGEDEGGEPDERPRNVTLTRPLLVQRHETTQAEWLELMGPHDFSLYPCDECPANRLSWNLALVYANRRSEADGLTPCYFDPEGRALGEEDPDSYVDVSWPQGPACLGWRLPTEAEWECFARAGTQTAWWCGDERRCLDAVAWYANTATDHFEPTGLLPPNPWGLHDIHGNLWELTWDEYKNSYGPDATDPTGPSGFTSERVVRGGCFGCAETALRSANRSSVRRVDDYTNIGMRLVRSLPALP